MANKGKFKFLKSRSPRHLLKVSKHVLDNNKVGRLQGKGPYTFTLFASWDITLVELFEPYCTSHQRNPLRSRSMAFTEK